MWFLCLLTILVGLWLVWMAVRRLVLCFCSLTEIETTLITKSDWQGKTKLFFADGDRRLEFLVEQSVGQTYQKASRGTLLYKKQRLVSFHSKDMSLPMEVME